MRRRPGGVAVALGLLAWLALLSAGGAFAQDEAAIQKGKAVYEYWCSPCHDDGPAYPGTSALAAKYKGTGTPAPLEARTDLSRASIDYFVRRGVSVMPFFRKTEISDADLDALAAYLAGAHLTRGNAALERLQRGVAELEKRVTDDPTDHVNRTALAVTYVEAGRLDEAVMHLEEAIRAEPVFAEAHYNLGLALAEQGRTEAAVNHYLRALELKPGYHEAHNNLGGALVTLGKLEEAAIHFRTALRLDSRNAEAHVNLGGLLETQGQVDEAIGEYEAALAIAPDDAGIYHHLGRALAAQGRRGEAIVRYRRSVDLRPDFVPALVDLAWLLAASPETELRNGGRAIELAERARQLVEREHFIVMDTLAAAYAAGGRFDEAIRAARSAVELAEAAGARLVVVNEIRHRLEGYIEHRPYRMTAER